MNYWVWDYVLKTFSLGSSYWMGWVFKWNWGVSVCPSSLRIWSLYLLVGLTDPYNHTYSESLWWKIFKNHKRTQIQRDRHRQRHRQIASFCFFLLLLHFSKRIKDFIPPKIAPFSSPIFVSSSDQKFSLVKLCLSPWTQYFSSLKLLCFYLWVLNLFSSSVLLLFYKPKILIFLPLSPFFANQTTYFTWHLPSFVAILASSLRSNIFKLNFSCLQNPFYSLAYIILSFLSSISCFWT